MLIHALVVGLLQTNCYVIGDEASGEGAIIDPGGDAGRIWSQVNKSGAITYVRYVIDTHAHFDHTVGNRKVIELAARSQEAPPQLVVHPDAAPLLAAGGGAELFGFTPTPGPEPDRLVRDQEVLALGQLSLQVLHTPGHSPGSISLYCAEAGVLFSGDVLFRQGIGRPDLPGGDQDTLLHSIQDRLFALPDDTVVYPGHGPSTTIGQEKRDNLFVR